MSLAPQLLAMPTGQRPLSLRRALASYGAHFAAHQRQVALAVFHSPRNAREQQEVQTAVAGAKVSARYVGLAEKVALAKELRRATGVGTDLLELALFNPERHVITTGSNRNAALLWGAGVRALHADDDTLAVLHAHPESGPGEATDAPVTDGDACDYFVPTDGDMARFALAAGDARLPREGLAGALEAAWRVLPAPLAFFGLAGDCGWGSPFGFWGAGLGYLLLPDRALARIAGDARVWRETLARRTLLHCAERLRASRHAVGMTACFGVDGTAALPPFFPVSRGQDALFGALTERFSGKPSLQLPWAVAHVPLEARAFHGDEIFRSAASLDCARAMFAFLETLPAEADLAGFGRHLNAIGALAPPAFEEALRAGHGTRMRRLTAAARQRAGGLATLSAAWRSDLEGYCERVEQSLAASEPLWILDAGGNDAPASLERMRKLVAGFGALCEAWPALWKAAQAMTPAVAGLPARGTRSAAPTPSPALCSPYQSWLWRLHRLDPADTSYILFRAYAGRGQLRDDMLEEAVRVLASRHEALRLRFRGQEGDEPVIEPAPVGDVRLHRRDPMLAHARAADRLHHARRPLDLQRDLPFELTLVRDSDDAEHWELWLRVHHIVWDGVSESIFWRELGAIYANLCAGRPPLATLPPLQAGFREVAAQQRHLSTTTLAQAEAHWRTLLRGLPPELHISSRSAPQVRTSESERLTLPLPPALAESLRTLAQERRTTVAALALAAWQGLLARYSGQNDITVAVNIANRWSESEEAQIGLFMTVLPTRVDLGADPSLPALAARNQQALAAGVEHARLPFERLVAAVARGMGRRRFSLFHALFTHVPKVRAPAVGGLQLRELDRQVTQSGFELGLTIEDGDTGLAAVLVGNCALFSAADLARLGSALMSALGSLCMTPDAPLSSLDWLGSDRARLASWNTTEVSYPSDRALPELLRAEADHHPERVALSAGGEHVTYGELFRRADALAARLRAAGVHRESRVGVFLDRHSRLLESLLGVWLAGGGYVPLDPGFPKERLAFMLEDSGAAVLVTRRALVDQLPPYAGAMVCVDDAAEPAPSTQATAMTDAHAVSPESLAYVLYTSGSTGKPKGVEIHHRALVNFLHSMRREPGLGENDVLLALTTVSFDIAALELWLPLLVGARIELGGREEAADGQRLWDTLRRSGATVLQTTPATWRALFAAGFPGDAKLKAMIGGEALPADLAERLAVDCGEAWNMYGPTETTVWSSVWRIPRETPLAVRIGKPIANTTVRVLDDARREVPIGVVGEIYIGGDGVARGYLGRPELTAERFVSDPVAGGSARLYRTGDRGRWTPEGELECLGRNDDQIKLRGFRMEPGEIEAALMQLPEVAQAAVALHETTPSDPRLVAWLVMEPAMTLPTTQELRARLRSWLLEHMVPYHFIAVEALPLTPNGKVDRRALSKLFRAPAVVTDAANEAPTPDEASIIAEFERQLQRKVGLDSDFFENGGDSLSAVRLLGRIAAANPAAPTTGDLFLHSTPRLLAKLLRALADKAAPRRGHLVPLRQGGVLPALVVLHPIGGQLAAYGLLARHIDGHAPVYGLLAAADARPDYDTVTARCAAYVAEILEAIDRPVVLAGYSLGGLLAMECAAQLRARGREVPLVALFDTWVPRPPRTFVEKLAFRAAELRRFTWEERARWASIQLMRRLGPPEPVFEEELPLIDAAASEKLGRQALGWSPPHYTGDVILFRAEVDLRGYSTPPGPLGWDKSCSRLSVASLICDHTQMMREPQAERIAERLIHELRQRT